MMRELEIKDRNGDLLKEGDIVIGCRYWLTGDGYLKKKYPKSVRIRLEIVWDKFSGQYRLKEIEPIDEDKEADENNFYRGIGYHLKVSWDNKIRRYREDMICESLVKEESFWKEISKSEKQ